MASSKKVQQKSSPDHEHSMARSELSAIENGVKRLKKKMKGEGNIEAWVQSKITRAADYIDSAADYLDSGEHNVGEEWKMPERIDPNTIRASKRSSSIRIRSLTKSTNPHEAEVAQSKRKEPKMPLVRPGDTKLRNMNAEVEVSLVGKILQEIEEEKKGLYYYMNRRRKKGLPPKKPGQEGYPETLDIEEGLKQARKNVGASKCWDRKKVNPNKPTKIKGGTEVPNCIPEATRIPAKTGNLIMATLTWKGKYHVIKMFFPSLKTPNRKDVQYELQKIYPGSRLNSFHVTEYTPDEPFIQVSEEKKNLNDPIRTPGENKKFKVYVKDPKTGNINTVRFGDPNMEIKRDDPKRLKAFRSRHNCDGEQAKDKTTAKYWSCYQWRKGQKVDN